MRLLRVLVQEIQQPTAVNMSMLIQLTFWENDEWESVSLESGMGMDSTGFNNITNWTDVRQTCVCIDLLIT